MPMEMVTGPGTSAGLRRTTMPTCWVGSGVSASVAARGSSTVVRMWAGVAGWMVAWPSTMRARSSSCASTTVVMAWANAVRSRLVVVNS